MMIEIYEGDFALRETADNALNGWRHLALRVDSIEGAKAELEERGIIFSEPVKPARTPAAGSDTRLRLEQTLSTPDVRAKI